LVPLGEKLRDLAEFMANLSPAQRDMIVQYLAIAAAVGPVLIVVGKFITIVGGAIKIIGLLVAAFNPVTLAIGAVILAIGLAALAIKYLWDNSEDFRAAVIRIWEMIQAAIARVVDMIQTKLEENAETVDTLREAFKAVADFIMTYVVPVIMQFIETHLAMFIDVLLLVIETIVNWVAGLAKLIAKFIEVGVAISTWVTEALAWFEDLRAGIDEALGDVSKTVSSVWNGILTTITEILDKVKDAVRGAINFIIRGWNRLSFTVPGVTLPNGTTFGGFTISVPKIDELAKGGLVMGPTLALIGEAGPEMVLPLTGRAAEQAGVNTGGNSYNITVNAGVGDPAAIGRTVVESIRAYEKRSGKVFQAA